METYLTRFTDYLLTQSWQIALLVVVIAAVSLVLRNKSAHVRYLLWLIVLAKCLVPPLLTVPVAILPQEKPAIVFEVVSTTISKPLELPLEPVKVTPAPMVSERPAKLNIHQWLGAGWIVGITVFLVFNLLKAVRTNYWLWRKRKALPAESRSDIENLFSAHGIKSSLSIWQIDGISQPFVWGLLRGSIYLPANFLNIKKPEHQKSVLGHELSHVIRFDAAVNFMQVIAQAIFWFHPFVWWANRKIRAEREKCCDEMAVARLNASPKDYSKAILEILAAKHESTRPVPSLAVAGPVKNIEERIKTMLRPGKKFYKRPSLAAATVVLLLALLTVPTALVLTARAEAKTAAESEVKPVKTLHEAAAEGDIEQVRLLISKGADVNAKDEDGQTPLLFAAWHGHKDIAELLMAKGADVDARDNWGNTPLGLTARYGHRNVAELLIDKGADVNGKDEDYWPPLHVAAWSGHKDLVELLVAKGADVNRKDEDGETAADLAIKVIGRFQNEIVKLLMDKGASVSALQGIYLAAYLGDLSKVESYIKQGKDIDTRDKDGRMLLHIAAMAGQKEVLEFLISRGADVNAKGDDGNTALEHAQWNHHKDILQLLLAKGAINTFPKGWWPTGANPENYEMRRDTSQKHGGRASAYIKFKGNRLRGFGALVQSFKADSYRGKRVQMSAWIKTQNMPRAQLCMRLDGAKRMLGFDNMGDRPVKGTTDWHEYKITLDVPESTVSIVFGALVLGEGQAWIDDFRFEVVGTDVPSTNMLTPEGMNQEWPTLAAQRSREFPPKPVNLDFEDLHDVKTKDSQGVNTEDNKD